MLCDQCNEANLLVFGREPYDVEEGIDIRDGQNFAETVNVFFERTNDRAYEG